MKTLLKFQDISLYTDNVLFDDEDILGLGDGSNHGPPNFVGACLRQYHAVYVKVSDYITNDYCRAIFLLCLWVIALSVVAYRSGYTKKNDMQNYLVLMEEHLDRQRKADALLRNINGLCTFLQVTIGEQEGGYPQPQRVALEYVANIKRYFEGNNLSYLEKFYKDKVSLLEGTLLQGHLPVKNTTAFMNDFAGGKNLAILRDHLNIIYQLRYFAGERHEVITRGIERLESDPRRVLVGGVSSYNFMMDFAFGVGGMFLIMGIASIPGLGRYVKTGFV